jgi:hypothetical protein
MPTPTPAFAEPAARLTAADWAAAWQAESAARAADYAALIATERAAILAAVAIAALLLAALLLAALGWLWLDLRRRIAEAAVDPAKLLPYLAEHAEHLSRLGRAFAGPPPAPAPDKHEVHDIAAAREARR